MEPVAPPPADQRPMTWHSRWKRWKRLRRSWRSWVPFVPPVVYFVGLILHVRLNSVVGSLLNVVCFAFYGILLAPHLLSAIRTKPSVFRPPMMRRLLAGAGFFISANGCFGCKPPSSVQNKSPDHIPLGR